MILKLMTLNLWRYYGDWDLRKKEIIAFIKQEKPDVIFFQETFDDARFNRTDNNQAAQLNKYLKFKNCIYDKIEKVKTERGQILNAPVFDGLACLTDFDVLKHRLLKLKKQKEDKHKRGIQIIELLILNKKITFFHTHFSNRDDWAKFHLKETIGKAKSKKDPPIILGDLNIKVIKDIFELSNKIYTNSYDSKKYISYPMKNETLDFVLIPKQCRFVEISCNKDGLSDHRPLITIIQID